MYLRCDDIFVDTNIQTCRRIWALVHDYGFNQILAVVPRGRGDPLHHHKPARQGNEWVLKHTGRTWFGSNAKLLDLVKKQLKRGDVLGLHGYYHIAYGREGYNTQRRDLTHGRRYLRGIFNTEIPFFVPPFNNFNGDTEKITRKLGMEITIKPDYELDVFITRKKNDKSDIRKRARQDAQSQYYPFYHPFWLEGGWREDKVYIDRHEQYFRVRAGEWDLDWALERLEVYLRQLRKIKNDIT